MVSASPDLSALQERLGVRLHDEALLITALTHPSYSNEHPEDESGTNERLEFLGDAVLGMVVAEALYARFPGEGEGRLTEWRAQLVMGPTLARVASALRLGEALRLGRGEEATGGRDREGNMERVYEAVLGAVMLDGGLDAAREFVHRTLREHFDDLAEDQAAVNPKGALQQLTQGEMGRPDYVTVDEQGPEHERHFTVEVRIDGEPVGRGEGASKQDAEKQAARAALPVVRERVARLTEQGGEAG